MSQHLQLAALTSCHAKKVGRYNLARPNCSSISGNSLPSAGSTLAASRNSLCRGCACTDWRGALVYTAGFVWCTTSARAITTADVISDANLASVDELRRQRDVQARAEEREALLIFERARQAQAGGKPAVATVYYRSAAKRATGALRQEILAAWRSMNAATTGASPQPISDRGNAGR